MSKRRNKGKAVVSSPAPTPYKQAVIKTTGEAQVDAIEAVPDDLRLGDDAYLEALKPNHSAEYVYPYIPKSTYYLVPLEKKFSGLNPSEVGKLYLKEFADPFLYPKEMNFYLAILRVTDSIILTSHKRNEEEWAFTKVTIRGALTPDQWNGDLFQFRELPRVNPNQERLYYNYFDYIKAWDGAFTYENSVRAHSWFFQFRDFNAANIPQWFVKWFYNWGVTSLILPKKVRRVYEDFKRANSHLEFQELMFSAHYQVPWIMKWDLVIAKIGLRSEEKLANIPHLGRRVLVRWWDKFDFFRKDSIFSQKGLIHLRPSPVPMAATPQKKEPADILKELMGSSSKEEVRKLLINMLEDSEQLKDEEEDKNSQPSGSRVNLSSPDIDMQDSQDPYTM